MKKIAFNIQDMKPACYNLQAMFNGTPSLASEFPTHSWDMTPSDKIKSYPIMVDMKKEKKYKIN